MIINWPVTISTAQFSSSYYEWANTSHYIEGLEDLAHANAIDGNLALIQKSLLVPVDLLHLHALDGLTLTQKHTLVLAELLHAHILDNVTVVPGAGGATLPKWNNQWIQRQVMSWQDIDAPKFYGYFTYQRAGVSTGIMLSVPDLLHAQGIDAVILTQKHTLTGVSDVAHVHALDAVVISSVVVTDLTHAHLLDGNLSLVQHSTLAIADALHAHAMENVPLSQSGYLVIQTMDQAQTLDVVTLTQKHTLAVSDLQHIHGIENTVLGQKNLLTVQEMLHAHGLNRISWVVASGVVTVDFSGLAPTVTIDAVAPGVTITGIRPEVVFDGE